MNFTELEIAVLKSLLKSSSANGHDFGFPEAAIDAVPSKRQLSGVISSLTKKKVIDVFDNPNPSKFKTQFNWLIDAYELEKNLNQKQGE